MVRRPYVGSQTPAIAASTTAPSAVFAQIAGPTSIDQAATTPSRKAEPVVVAAETLRAAFLNDLTQPVEVVTNHESLDQAHTDLTEVLRMAPGAQFQ